VSANLRNSTAIAALAAGLLFALPAAAQTTLFNTPDYKRDTALWTDPAYYKNNTFSELREMQVEVRYGREGTAKQALELASPYPFKTAEEHYQAWLTAANGGTKHTNETIPDWRGRWVGGNSPAMRNGDNPASTAAAMLTPQHREYFVQAVKAASEGRDWWPGAICLPTGFISSLTATDEFIAMPHRVWILGSSNNRNYIRWIYTDGSGHVREDHQYGKWQGESVGFWDGDALVIHTNQIRGWKSALFEYTDNMTAVEKYRRVGDQMQGEITLYDPEVFIRPFHSKITYRFDRAEAPEGRPQFNTCTDTNGPSNKVYMNDKGQIDERLPGEPDYWDPTDARPWATFFEESEQRYRRSGGAAPASAPAGPAAPPREQY
jgi:hypothetical protein